MFTVPAISVVIPSYNSERTILELVRSIFSDKDFSESDEIVIVDDNSTDCSANIAEAEGARVLRQSTNLGPAVARNVGANAARNSIVFFLDSDTCLEPGAIGAVKRHFADGSSARCVNGRCSPVPITPGPAQLYKALVEYTWHEAKPDLPSDNICFNARVGAIDRELFLSTGGYDLRFKKADVEDHEFSNRLTKLTAIDADDDIQVRHDFPDFLGTIRAYWDRSAKWVDLFLDEQNFLEGGTSAGSASTYLAGFFFLVALLSIYVQFELWPIAGVFGALFVYLSRTFLLFVISREGILVGGMCLFFHFFYSQVIVSGAGFGLLKGVFRRLRELGRQTRTETASKTANIVKFAIGGGVLVFLLSSGLIDFDLFTNFLEHPGTLTASIFGFCLMIMLTSVRWWLLLTSLDPKLRLLSVLKVDYIGYFANVFLPSTAGSDVVRTILVSRQSGIHWGSVAASALMHRLLGMIGLLIIGIVAIAVGMTAETSLRADLEDYLFWAIGSFVFTSLVMLTLPRWLNGFIALLERSSSSVLHRIIDVLRRIADATSIFAAAKWRLLVGLVISLLVHAISIWMLLVIVATVWTMAAPISLQSLAAVLAFLANIIPITPGGVGIGEGTFAQSCIWFESAAAAPACATAFILLRLIGIAVSMPAVLLVPFVERVINTCRLIETNQPDAE